MRTNIVHAGAHELSYEIREIVVVGKEVAKRGRPITWENIGDPVEKGETLPKWIKEIVQEHINDDRSFGYGPTPGLERTREFLAEYRSKESGITLGADDIIFFNGLGDAISKVYTYLNKNARVIGPSPAYSTHSSAEAAHAGAAHLTYELNPARNWLPDVNDLRNKVHYNPNIAGILIINPDNPTGMVYPKAVLEEIVRIAKEYDLFIISDEIYANIVYGDEKMVPLASLAARYGVPGLAMRGISKEMPWPGSRCGWIEVYNRNADPLFSRYIRSVVDAKMLEVCSTTLPQSVIPDVMSDPRYAQYLKTRRKCYQEKADIAYDILRDTPGITAPKPSGAFYITVVFDPKRLSRDMSLSIEKDEVRSYIEEAVRGAPSDRRFVYYMMGAAGVCVVPLSGFNTGHLGFRFTLLEPDVEIFTETVRTIRSSITSYLRS